MLALVKSAALFGIQAQEVTVEVDASAGLPGETIVGLPDTVVKESRTRIKAAIKNSGFRYPVKAITVNLAPAELRKEGPFLDLPIAVGILQTTGQLPPSPGALFVGELSLDGSIKPIRGAVAIGHLVLVQKIPVIFIPFENLEEVSLIPDISVVAVRTLADIQDFFEGHYPPPKPIERRITLPQITLDFGDVKGQFMAKRALEIAAAGHHNILFVGSPGTGKTMLMKRLPSILPPLSFDHAIEVYKIASISRKVQSVATMDLEAPFRSPHHTISYAGMVGGGKTPMPGEVSLAHRGVLFLDELPEFPRQIIDILRQPIEDRQVVISRANFTLTYPTHFLLAAAMNPCPCGYHRDPFMACRCPKTVVASYQKRLSGPMLDRFDLIVEIPRLSKDDLFSENNPSHAQHTTSVMKTRVFAARARQEIRFGTGKTNTDMGPSLMKQFCAYSKEGSTFLSTALDKGLITGRSLDKVLKVARTLADLAGEETLTLPHLAEALQYRRTPFLCL